MSRIRGILLREKALSRELRVKGLEIGVDRAVNKHQEGEGAKSAH